MTFFTLCDFKKKFKMEDSGSINDCILTKNEDCKSHPNSVEQLTKHCENFLKEFETLKTAKDKNLKTLEMERENVLQNVKDMKKMFVKYLDKLEEDAVETTNKLYDAEFKELTKQRDSLDKMVSKAQSQEEELKKYVEKGFTTVEYWHRTYFESAFAEYRTYLMNIHENSFHVYSKFERNTDLVNSICNLKSYGKISMIKSKSGCVLPRMSVCPLIDRTAFASGETNTMLSADLEIPSVHEMHIMDNGNILVCDDNNKKIKLFDTSNKPLSDVSLSSVPHGFTLLNQYEAMITLPIERQLNIVKIQEELVLEKKVKTKLMYGPVTKFKDTVIVFAEGKYHNYLNVINKQGHRLKCIRREKRNKQTNGIFQKVTCIAVSSDNETVYITDLNNGCIGLSMKGKVVFRFADVQVSGYSGVCTTSEGDIFITGKETNNVILVKKNKETVKEIVSANLRSPSFVSYCKERNQLLVTQSMSDTVKSFNLL